MLLAFLRLVRISNLLLLAGSLSASLFLLVKDLPDATIIASWLGAVVLTAAGGYVINDWADLAIDRINNPLRPLPAEKIRPKQAKIFAVALFLGGLACALANWKLFILTSFATAVLVAYALRLKCTPLLGNLTVAALSAASFASLWLIGNEVNSALCELVLFAALTHFLREQVKCLEDTAGDRAAGCRTLPVVTGVRKARKIAFYTAIAVVSACLATSLKQQFFCDTIGWWLFSVAFAAIIFGLQSADSPTQFRRLSLLIKVLMAAGTFFILYINSKGL